MTVNVNLELSLNIFQFIGICESKVIQATDAYSSYDRIKEIYKTFGLSLSDSIL
jgi:hypothetical protein